MPSDFLSEERRCDYVVTTDTKKLWAVELDCLKVLNEICEKHGISFFAGGGTLLGAVRHQGFIPWDDDIDVFMEYQDYIKFCSIAPKEIVDPFFFQNYITEDGFGPGFSRIRQKNSTGCTKYDYAIATENYNCGVFIDIFPLFNVETNFIKRFAQKIDICFWRLAIAGYERERADKLQHSSVKRFFRPTVTLWHIIGLFYSHVEVSNKYLRACSKTKSSDKIGLISFSGFNKRFIWDKGWFDESVTLPFEFIMIPCPKQYDSVLSTMYGNYHEFVKGGQIHTLVVCNPNVPYWVSLKDRFKNYDSKDRLK